MESFRWAVSVHWMGLTASDVQQLSENAVQNMTAREHRILSSMREWSFFEVSRKWIDVVEEERKADQRGMFVWARIRGIGG